MSANFVMQMIYLHFGELFLWSSALISGLVIAVTIVTGFYSVIARGDDAKNKS